MDHLPMSTSPTPDVIDRAEIAALIARIDAWSLDECDGPRLRRLLVLLLKLVDEVESKQTTIRKLEGMLFGPSSEARPRDATDENPVPPDEGSAPTPTSASVAPPDVAATDPKPARPGHKRRPASRFAGAERVTCADLQLQA